MVLLRAAGARSRILDALESDVGKLDALRLVGRRRVRRIRLVGTRDRRVRHEIGVRCESLHRDRMAHDRRRTVRIDRNRLVVRT